ncbi:MAG: hypothetical protein R3B82_06265 [Sandaracinaceae bacterium]
MQMRAGIYRVLRIALVAGVAWLGYQWLAPMGLGWVVLALAGLAAGGWVVFRLVRIRRERALDARADRWAEALMSPPHRPAAIREIRGAREAARSRPEEHARLTLVLAELLEADGDAKDAVEVLEETGTAGLAPPLRAVMRHARAVAHLSAGDPEAARRALDEDTEPSGDRAMELRLRMMRGLIDAETGNAAAAKKAASEAREEALDDEDLRVEARVLEAVAFDAAGQRTQAIERMNRLGDEMLEILAVLGLPRVRELATEALASDVD